MPTAGNLRLTSFTRDALAAAFKALVEGANAPGSMRIYDGTAPATANSVVDATLLANMPMHTIQFDVTTATDTRHGRLTLRGELLDANTVGGGVSSWGEILDTNGNKLLDFFCPDDVQIDAIEKGGQLRITSFIMIIPEEC